MVFSDKYKLIFIHIPKTSGTSIEKALNLMNNNCGYGIKNNKAMQHYLWDNYKKYYPNKWKTYRKFSICRNPYTRFVSEYYWCMVKNVGYKGGQTIDQFIEYCKKVIDSGNYNTTIFHDHFIPQHKYIYDNNGNLMVDELFKMEEYSKIEHFLQHL